MELLERVISAPDRDWAQLALPIFAASTVVASISTHGCRGPYQILQTLPPRPPQRVLVLCPGGLERGRSKVRGGDKD